MKYFNISSNFQIKPIFTLIILSCFFCLPDKIYSYQIEDNSLKDSHSIRDVLISAHRAGPQAGYPENSLETIAFNHSIMPNQMYEVDVIATADTVLILMHDKTLDRTTNFSGEISEMKWEAMKDAKLVDNQGLSTNFSIPVFDSLLVWVAKNEAFLSLDVKDEWTWKIIMKKVAQYEVKDKVEVITYNLEDAITVHNIDPTAHLSVNVPTVKEMNAYLNNGFNPKYLAAFTGLKIRPASYYKILSDHGFIVTLGTLFNLDEIAVSKGDSLYSLWKNMGVNRMATDRPLAVFAELNKN